MHRFFMDFIILSFPRVLVEGFLARAVDFNTIESNGLCAGCYTPRWHVCCREPGKPRE